MNSERTPTLTLKNLDRELPRLSERLLSRLHESLDDLEAEADPRTFPEFRKKVTTEVDRRQSAKLDDEAANENDGEPVYEYDRPKKGRKT